MNTNHYLNKVTGRKGQFIQVQWTRTMKTAAVCSHYTVTKSTKTTARTGIEYDHIAAVQEKRANGELPPQNAGLPTNMEWMSYPYIITHSITGKQYARIYPLKGSHAVVQYYLNGKAVDRDQILPYLTPSDARNEKEIKRSDCFIVQIQDIEFVG